MHNTKLPVPKAPRLKAASVQFTHRPGDKTYNLSVIETFVKNAAQQGVQLVAFPEMCVTGYWHVRNLNAGAVDALAESIPAGRSARFLIDLAVHHQIIIGAGLIEKDQGRYFNSYLVAMPDGRHHVHRKLHTFINPCIDSGENYTVFDTPLGYRLGVLTCWDNNLVENARMMALLGCDVLMAPHQTGGCDSRSPEAMGMIDVTLWENRNANPEAIEAEFRGPKGREWLMRWLPSRAHDNGMFILFANGVGRDDDEVRTGNAMIIDCYGRILGETWQAADAMVTAELDLDMLKMCTGRRWLRGRRPELYSRIAQRQGGELDPRAARFSYTDTTQE